MLITAESNATVSLWSPESTSQYARTTRKGQYFRGELPVNNSSTAKWMTITNLAVLNDGNNPDIVTNTVGNTFVPKTAELFYYDYDGNLTNDGRWTYTWDAENRLVRMVANTAVGPQQRIEFEYDARSRRIGKKVWNNTAGTGSPAVEQKFVYDGWNLLAVLSSSSSLLSAYTWGLDLSGSEQGAGGVGGLLMLTNSGNGTHYCAYDGNGNLAALVKATDGAVTANYEYGPFGEPLRVTGAMGLANAFRFSTKYQDDETDLLYYGYRSYNPSTGRWLSRDPIEENDSSNVYLFGGNDAADFWDLLGLRWNVSRNGGAKASAVPESGDTVADLANLIGLNAAEYQRWLTAPSGTAMPSSSSQVMTGCERFEVPNTVVAYWAGNLGWFGRWWVRWNSSVKYLRARGFNVDNQYHQKGKTWALTTTLASKSIGKELHGLYFWGHGSAPYPAQYLVSDTGDAVLAFSSPGLYYHMGLGLVFACDSNSGQHALMSGNGSQIWKGFSGTLVPWPFRAYHAKHYIHPGQQETH